MSDHRLSPFTWGDNFMKKFTLPRLDTVPSVCAEKHFWYLEHCRLGYSHFARCCCREVIYVF